MLNFILFASDINALDEQSVGIGSQVALRQKLQVAPIDLTQQIEASRKINLYKALNQYIKNCDRQIKDFIAQQKDQLISVFDQKNNSVSQKIKQAINELQEKELVAQNSALEIIKKATQQINTLDNTAKAINGQGQIMVTNLKGAGSLLDLTQNTLNEVADELKQTDASIATFGSHAAVVDSAKETNGFANSIIAQTAGDLKNALDALDAMFKVQREELKFEALGQFNPQLQAEIMELLEAKKSLNNQIAGLDVQQNDLLARLCEYFSYDNCAAIQNQALNFIDAQTMQQNLIEGWKPMLLQIEEKKKLTEPQPLVIPNQYRVPFSQSRSNHGSESSTDSDLTLSGSDEENNRQNDTQPVQAKPHTSLSETFTPPVPEYLKPKPKPQRNHTPQAPAKIAKTVRQAQNQEASSPSIRDVLNKHGIPAAPQVHSKPNAKKMGASATTTEKPNDVQDIQWSDDVAVHVKRNVPENKKQSDTNTVKNSAYQEAGSYPSSSSQSTVSTSRIISAIPINQFSTTEMSYTPGSESNEENNTLPVLSHPHTSSSAGSVPQGPEYKNPLEGVFTDSVVEHYFYGIPLRETNQDFSVLNHSTWSSNTSERSVLWDVYGDDTDVSLSANTEPTGFTGSQPTDNPQQQDETDASLISHHSESSQLSHISSISERQNNPYARRHVIKMPRSDGKTVNNISAQALKNKQIAKKQEEERLQAQAAAKVNRQLDNTGIQISSTKQDEKKKETLGDKAAKFIKNVRTHMSPKKPTSPPVIGAPYNQDLTNPLLCLPSSVHPIRK